MITTSGSVIGIDVGFSPTKRSSAICRLDWTSSVVSWEIARFRAVEPERESAIASIVARRSISTAAVDGPIRRGFDVIGRYRLAEQMLTRRLRPLIGKPGQSSAPVGKLLNHHANECVRHLFTHADLQDAQHLVRIDQKSIVEAFPSSFLGMMIDEPNNLKASRNDRSDIFFQNLVSTGVLQSLIGHCLPEQRLSLDPCEITNHDDRASLVCALSALVVAAGDFVAVGDDDGWIVLPPRSFIKSTQWEMLNRNAEETGKGVLQIEG